MQCSSYQHEFEVNYSKWGDLPINHYIGFPAFQFEGFEWAFHYYPNYDSKCNQFFSLVLLSKAKGVCAEIFFSLIHKKRTSSVLTLQSSLHTFNGNNAKYGTIVATNEVEAFMDSDNTFIVACTIIIRVLSGTRSIVNTSSCGLQGYLRNLLDKGETSDVTFEVEGEKICAHKLILASKSPVFEAAFFGPMAEADLKCIKIEDMKADVFKAMLSFMYTDHIADDGSENLGLQSTEWVLDLLAAADRYGLDKLKDICEVMLGENLSVETVSIILLLSDRYRCLWLKEMCLQFASIPKNLAYLAFDSDYIDIMHYYPSLKVELREKANSLSRRN